MSRHFLNIYDGLPSKSAVGTELPGPAEARSAADLAPVEIILQKYADSVPGTNLGKRHDSVATFH
jgi:hypothetical protein